jgi:plasmid stability protein
MAMLQVRNLSDDTHRILKSRAALDGRSLSDYVARELDRVAAAPTMAEFLDRIHQRGGVTPATSAADLIREDRDSR